jgi:hypothetical protein
LSSGRGFWVGPITRPEESYRMWWVQRPLPDNTQHSQQKTPTPPAGVKPTLPASERLQTHALDSATTGIGIHILCVSIFFRQSVDYVLFSNLTVI